MKINWPRVWWWITGILGAGRGRCLAKMCGTPLPEPPKFDKIVTKRKNNA